MEKEAPRPWAGRPRFPPSTRGCLNLPAAQRGTGHFGLKGFVLRVVAAAIVLEVDDARACLLERGDDIPVPVSDNSLSSTSGMPSSLAPQLMIVSASRNDLGMMA